MGRGTTYTTNNQEAKDSTTPFDLQMDHSFRSFAVFIIAWFFCSMSTSTNADALAAETGGNNGIPQLTPPNPNSNLPTFKLGETIRLEEMGPIIINTDGESLS